MRERNYIWISEAVHILSNVRGAVRGVEYKYSDQRKYWIPRQVVWAGSYERSDVEGGGGKAAVGDFGGHPVGSLVEVTRSVIG